MSVNSQLYDRLIGEKVTKMQALEDCLSLHFERHVAVDIVENLVSIIEIEACISRLSDKVPVQS